MRTSLCRASTRPTRTTLPHFGVQRQAAKYKRGGGAAATTAAAAAAERRAAASRFFFFFFFFFFTGERRRDVPVVEVLHHEEAALDEGQHVLREDALLRCAERRVVREAAGVHGGGGVPGVEALGELLVRGGGHAGCRGVVEEEEAGVRQAREARARRARADDAADAVALQVRGMAAGAAAREHHVGGGAHVVAEQQVGQRGVQVAPAAEERLAPPPVAGEGRPVADGDEDLVPAGAVVSTK